MPIIVYPSSPKEAAAYWLAGSHGTRVPKQDNINAIVRLLQTNKPVYKIKGTANRIVATQRRSLVTKARKNINRGRQERAERILVSRAGLGNSILNKNAISQIAKYLSTRAANR